MPLKLFPLANIGPLTEISCNNIDLKGIPIH